MMGLTDYQGRLNLAFLIMIFSLTAILWGLVIVSVLGIALFAKCQEWSVAITLIHLFGLFTIRVIQRFAS